MSNKTYNRPLEHKEYIQMKYLSQTESKQNDSKKKSKKKVVKNKTKKIRIFDDDIDLKNMDTNGSEDELYFGTKEEKPIIAEVVDERPLHMRRKDIDKNRWKTIESNVEEVDGNEDNINEEIDKNVLTKSHKKPKSLRNDLNNDLSLQKNHNTSDGQKRRRHDSDSDLSPEREPKEKKSRNESQYDSDLSPPRHRSPKGDKKWNKSESNRRGQDSDSDLSPPRTQRSENGYKSSARREQTLSGKKSGLSDAKYLREELMATKRREQKMFESISDEMLGKNAKTVFRDKKSGQIRDLEEEVKLKNEKDLIKQKIDSEKKAKYDKWAKGLVQTEQQKQTLAADLHEMSKPLARYEGDEDLDQMLREKERDDDPMLATIKKNRAKQEIKAGGVKVKPTYKGPTPPINRFNIRPGYRWDGVDRSNGFENKYFDRISNKEATLEEAYRWSTQDM